MKKRRDLELFSLSFLDCICCGFGAIILLFILSMGVTRSVEEESKEQLQQRLQQMQAAFGTLVKERERLAGELDTAEKSLSEIITEIASLQALIDDLKQKIQNEEAGRKALITEIEKLHGEIPVLQTEADIPQIDATTPIGVPVESNYVAFVIDTSGSMREPDSGMLWPYVIDKFAEVLTVYPEVKGVQFLDADGRFVIGRSGTWIPDSKETRKNMLDAVRRYQIASNSNPVPGILRAMRTLYDAENKEMHMGIYVFGDEFDETSESVLTRIDRFNPPDEDGKRPITINGVGFPNLLHAGFSLGQTGLKFANLMREVTQRHGGAFIAVTQ